MYKYITYNRIGKDWVYLNLLKYKIYYYTYYIDIRYGKLKISIFLIFNINNFLISKIIVPSYNFICFYVKKYMKLLLFFK